MSKPQRMAVMSVACLIAAGIQHRGWDDWVLGAALGVIILGAAWTCVRRTRAIVAALSRRSGAQP